MKKLILFLFIIMGFFLSTNIHSQTIKLKTFEMSYTNDYGEWGDWEDSKILISIDIDNDRISLYTKEIQEFDVYSSEEDYSQDYDSYFIFQSLDNKGKRCQLRLGIKDKLYQLYIDFSDGSVVFNAYKLD